MRTRKFMTVLKALACVGPLVLPVEAAPVSKTPRPTIFDEVQARSDYVENCGGCHGIQGSSAPALVPELKNRVGYFMCDPAARAYLLRLPNVAHSRITDNAQLADLMNFVVFRLGGGSAPPGTSPFTGDEVTRERQRPLASAALKKMRLDMVNRLIRTCKVPSSLRLLYLGQPG